MRLGGLILSVALFSMLAVSTYAEEGLAVLKKDVGTWDAEIKMFADPSAPPSVSKGVETNRMVGSSWLHSSFKGSVMGEDFEGVGQMTYDAKSKKYVGTWIDSMTPTMSKTEGTWDEKTQTLTSTMDGKDPTGSDMTSKMTVVYNKDGSRSMTMWGLIGGQEVKMMEIKYTRAASESKK